MERTYKDVADKSTNELARTLVDLLVDRYMADPDMARLMLTELLEKEVTATRSELIDELYDMGYWA